MQPPGSHNDSSPIDTARWISYLLVSGRGRSGAKARVRPGKSAAVSSAGPLGSHRLCGVPRPEACHSERRICAPQRGIRSGSDQHANYLEDKRRRSGERYPLVRATWTEEEAARSREATRRWRERLKADPAKYEKHAERSKAARRARYAADRDAVLDVQRKYTEKHRQEIYARNRAYAQRNRKKIAAQQHEAYVRDLEANRARHRDRQRKAYAADPKKYLDYLRKWRAANPERARGYVRLAGHRRRAAAGGEHIRVEDWERLLQSHKGRCAYCGEVAALIEADHRTPLSRGGRNTIDNILPACRSCNRRKRTKTEGEFRAYLAELASELRKGKDSGKQDELAEAAGPYRTTLSTAVLKGIARSRLRFR